MGAPEPWASLLAMAARQIGGQSVIFERVGARVHHFVTGMFGGGGRFALRGGTKRKLGAQLRNDNKME